MIYPASKVLLASLVVNAALVFGAPIRTSPPSHNVARAVDDDPLVERVHIEHVPSHMRSVDPDPSEARSIPQAREIAPENAIRNTAPSDEVEARDPLPEIERIVRRYPRRSLYERHETRSTSSSTPPEARSPSPEAESPPVVRRFFRRELFERHQARSESSTPPLEAREPAPQEDVAPRKFPRKILAEYYVEKRTPEPAPAPPSIPEPPVAREPEPEPELPTNRIVRRFARRGMAEKVEARQDPADTPPAPPTGDNNNTPPIVPVAPPAQPSSAAPLAAASPTKTATGTATASASIVSGAATATTTATTTNPVVEIINANKAANFVNPSSLPQNGLPVEIDREHETTVYHQKTTEHISQCNGEVKANPGVAPVASAVPSGTTAPTALPSSSGTPPVTPVTPPVPPVVPAQGNNGGNANANPNPVEPPKPTATTTQVDASVVPSQVTDPQLNPTPAVLPANGGDAATGTPDVARRDDVVADPIILRGRALGFSGPAYASYLKRSTMN